MKHIKTFEEYSQIEQIDEGLFSSSEQKGWQRMNTYSLMHYIIQSWKKSYTHESSFKKTKIDLSDLTKEDWEKWAKICKENNNDYKKVINAVKNDEKLNKINNYIIYRASTTASAKSPSPHGFGNKYVPPQDDKEFDAIKAVNIAFKQLSV